jgi:hypothetical protein
VPYCALVPATWTNSGWDSNPPGSSARYQAFLAFVKELRDALKTGSYKVGTYDVSKVEIEKLLAQTETQRAREEASVGLRTGWTKGRAINQ